MRCCDVVSPVMLASAVMGALRGTGRVKVRALHCDNEVMLPTVGGTWIHVRI